MTRNRAFAISALVCALAALPEKPVFAEQTPTGTPTEWEVQKVKEGITTRRRKWPGYSLHEFQGECTIDVPLALVLAVMEDVNHRSEWSANNVEARQVAQLSANEMLLYDRTSAPWPVKDRDVVLHVKFIVDPAAHEVRVEFDSVVDPRAPEVKSAVRMPYLHGHWTLRASDDTHTFVEYQVHADPGGSIPDWVSNLVSKAMPYKTLQGLRKQVQNSRYAELAQKVMERAEYRAMKK